MSSVRKEVRDKTYTVVKLESVTPTF
jgi:hypothetical protein